jgi:hypothetical protein
MLAPEDRTRNFLRLARRRRIRHSSQRMIAILDVPGIKERVSPLSVSEYHQLGEYNKNGRRTELVRGIVIEKFRSRPSIVSSRKNFDGFSPPRFPPASQSFPTIQSPPLIPSRSRM